MSRDLASMRNQYDGRRIFVIGNGPSLSQTPLEQINTEYTFAMNGINKIYSETSWRPDFYFTMRDPTRRIKRFVNENAESGTVCFLPDRFSQHYKNDGNKLYFPDRSLQNVEKFDDMSISQSRNVSIDWLLQYWSQDIATAIYSYHSTYPVLQIVAYLGFDDVYLLGCDLGFGKNNPHMLFNTGIDPLDYVNKGDRQYDYPKIRYLSQTTSLETLIKSTINGVLFKILSSSLRPAVSGLLSKAGIGGDDAHFTEDYVYKPRDLTDVNTDIIKEHIISRRIYSRMDSNIFNATIEGNLEVHPRVDITEIISE
jgi:hypothetical protein